jgi:hypothetical protein
VVTLPGGGPPVSVHLTFDSVTSGGTTTVTASPDATGGVPTSPPSFKVGDPPLYYDVDTTASFAGPVNLCFPWQDGQFDEEGGIALFHFENGAWQNVTTSLDTNANSVCGQVSSFSPFALFAADYTFSEFFQPVDNQPTRNTSKAGSAIPVKFSLNGNQGLKILAAGYPRSQPISCSSGTVSDPVEETVTANASGLSYDASMDRYTYAWKTDKAWAKSCRRLILRLNDGSVRSADFEFAK